MRLDYADVVAAIGVRAAVDDDRHQIVHSVGINRVVRLKR